MLLLAALWLQFFYALHPFWQDGLYYDYGWFVPPAAAYFFWLRWQDASLKHPPGQPPAGPLRSLPAPLLPTLVTLGVLFIIALRFLETFDPSWRLPLWAHAAVLLTVHHALLFQRFGAASLHFAGISILTLSAVPMPSFLQSNIIEGLTAELARCSVPLSRFQGLPVELSGNALVAGGQVLEIDEGCSGVRSLQSLIMTALFAGELFRLALLPRVALFLSGIALSFVFNLLRTTSLTWIFFEHGQASFDRWHDTIGTSTFAGSAVTLLAIAWWFDRPGGAAYPADADPSPSVPPAPSTRSA